MDGVTNVISPSEANLFVQNLTQFHVHQIGSEHWIRSHNKIVKLLQQAVLEASGHREENIKELFLLYKKLDVLVHEAHCTLLWRTKILPKLLERGNLQASFLIYTVLYHEGVVVNLMELLLYHEAGIELLYSSAIDLIDYCVEQITHLIGLVNVGHVEGNKINSNETSLNEIQRQKFEILYKIGLRCITILSHLSHVLSSLPLSIAKRIMTTHDVPSLLCEILHLRPWLRRSEEGFEKFIDDKWVNVGTHQINEANKSEAQTWFCLYELLFNSIAMQHYELSSSRISQLTKISGLLNNTLLDQVPVLGELKKFLCTISAYAANYKNKSTLIIEDIPQIRNSLLKEVETRGGFEKILLEHEKIFLSDDKNQLASIAAEIVDSYSSDMLVQFDSVAGASESKQSRKCATCMKPTTTRCSVCMSLYYCSRECQIDDWPLHKKMCTKPQNKK